MNKFAWVFGICLGLVAEGAAAQQQGAYFGAAGGIAFSDATKKGYNTYSSTTTNDTKGTGYKVYGGYSWGTWGVEAGYYDFAKYTIAGPISGIPSQDEYTLNAFGISAIGTFPIAKDWDFTGKLGIGQTTVKYDCVLFCTALIADQNTTSVVPVFGIGVKWNVQKNISLRVDWEGIANAKMNQGGSVRNLNAELLSIGAQVRF